jgi:hypothetical protein
MPTRYLASVPRELWPPQAAELEEIMRDSGAHLTPAWFGIPPRPTFTPKELAFYFSADADGASGVDTIIRLIQDGALPAVKLRGHYVIPWFSICYFLLKQQGAMN